MPLKSSQNHELIWVDLLKNVQGGSWYHLLSTLYNKNSGYSNYKNCKRREYNKIRGDIFEDEKVRQYIALNDCNKKKVDKILDEMCHLLQIQHNPTRKLKFAGFPFMRCITKVYSNIYVLNHLFSISTKKELDVSCDLFKKQYLEMSKELPIVILPTHRSYMDFLLISYIMFDNELPLPSVAAGDNFKAMGKHLCDYLKGTGAFLIRRNAHNKKDIEASTYYDILRAYIHSILIGGETPLEFFMEGTRTRTGQVLHPKTGLLSMVADMYLDKLIEDVYILPVSINYQRPIEEQLYVAETAPQVNMKKPKESAINLISAFRAIMKKKYGKVYVRFIKPFKLSEYYEEWKSITNDLDDKNLDKQIVLQEFTNSLASKVCLTQANNNILMPFNLIAFSLVYRSFLTQKTNVSFKENSNGCNYTDNNCRLESNNNQTIRMDLLMEDFQTIENTLMSSQPQFVPGWKSHLCVLDEFLIDRDDIIRASFDRQYIEFNYDEITFHTLQYYSNQVVQIILPLSICILIECKKNPSSNKNSLFEEYKSIRFLLEKEFLIDQLNLIREFEDSFAVIKKNLLTKESKRILVRHICYFIESYSIFLNYIKKNELFDKTKFFQYLNHDTVSKNGYLDKRNYMQNTFISKDMLKNMINLVLDMKICSNLMEDNQNNSPKTTSSKTKRPEEKLVVKSYEKLAQLLDKFECVMNLANDVMIV